MKKYVYLDLYFTYHALKSIPKALQIKIWMVK